MKSLLTFALAIAPWLQLSQAQAGAPIVVTDAGSGVVLDTWRQGGVTVGLALPPDALKTDATEFIGSLTCPSTAGQGTGWCGISIGGAMTNHLLLLVYPNDGKVLTSFRFATGYQAPALYTGNAKLTQISSSINATHFSLTYRCQNCLKWNQGGAMGSVSTTQGGILLGWVVDSRAPINPACPDTVAVRQHEDQGIFLANFDSAATNAAYPTWAAKATVTVAGTCAAPVTSTTAAPAPSKTGVPVPSSLTYDYIVVGAGAGGIPIADKLSEAGKSVLLIEKGPPSSGRWGGTVKPDWLQGTNLTRFDVPGLCNEIWANASGIACLDTDQMAGCVLGGGTAINAGLWWKPYPLDWDYNFPAGWKSTDMEAATSRVFSRIPGTTTPSLDGKIYLTDGMDVLRAGLKQGGFTEVDANSVPAKKNRTFSHTPYMFSGGERGGPMATYLVSASARSNFKLWTGTAVKKVLRTGGHITGVEVEPYVDGGFAGVINVTPGTGRVILSAGTFGSAKILLRSGIGPTDQLEVVKGSSDGPNFISKESWINTPVGYNLEDHTNTDTVVSHPAVQFYDFYEAFDAPWITDKDQYLDSRTGILAQAAPNIGPMFWEEITGPDGVVRQLQYTARMEGSLGVENGKAITISQYLGRGAKSRGRMTITSALSTVVSTEPYLRDQGDVEVVIQGIENIRAALKGVPNLVWNFPAANQTAREYVQNMVVSYSNRRSNHWIGTNKLGTDDGTKGGSAVVDLNAKVYGTDNLFVVDASIFPGHVTTNPSAYIVVASEHAAERILALAPTKGACKSKRGPSTK